MPEMIADVQVYLNGELVPGSEARIPVLDRSVLYGDAVFDSLPVIDGKALFFDRHLDRLLSAIKAVKIDPPLLRAELADVMIQTMEASDFSAGSLRTLVSRGTGPAGIANTDQLGEPTLLIIPMVMEEIDDEFHTISEHKAIIASTRTVPSDTIDPRIKSCNYLPNALAERETVGTPADTAIMLDQDGTVAECYAANVFVHDEDGKIKTPPERRTLGGITREVVLERARAQGYEVEVTDLATYDLLTAQDVMMTSSWHGIASIVEIDGQEIGEGEQSDRVLELAEAYRKYALAQEYVELDV